VGGELAQAEETQYTILGCIARLLPGHHFGPGGG
jgi:hypothetical protein